MNEREILADYEQQKVRYDDYRQEVGHLVERLLGEAGLAEKVVAVTSRVKDVDSLERKIAAPEKNYEELEDITDLAAVRIVTYFADDVDRVAALIQNEFEVDREKSVDKREILAPDAFGYLSLHYVCRLSDSRRELPENARFRDYRCEVQIRSLVQHAWAEIEHDLGYKSLVAVPANYQRRFSRVAGLFEVVDDEFMRLRDELRAHAADVADEVGKAQSGVDIDRDSVVAFLDQDATVRELDRKVAEIAWGSEIAHLADDGYVAALIPFIRAAGFSTIDDLRVALARFGDYVIEQTRVQSSDAERVGRTVPRGVSLFRLGLVVLGTSGPDAIAQAMLAAGWSPDRIPAFSEAVVEAMRAVGDPPPQADV